MQIRKFHITFRDDFVRNYSFFRTAIIPYIAPIDTAFRSRSMNAKSSYEFQLEARRARAAAQGALFAHLADKAIVLVRRGWSGLLEIYRHRLRPDDIVEA
jgi:hypothetical protein